MQHFGSKDFPHRRRLPNGGWEYSLHCGRDPCEHEETWEPGEIVMPQNVLSHFKRKGWGIGRDRTRDVCPECMTTPLKEAPPVIPIVMQPTPPVPPPVAAEALLPNMPPEPTPEPAPTVRRRKTYTRKAYAYRPVHMPAERGHSPGYNTRGFLHPSSAHGAAKAYLSKRLGRAVHDDDYVVYEEADGWAWDSRVPGMVAIIEPFEVLPFADYSAGRHRDKYYGFPGLEIEGSDFVYPPDNKAVRRRNDALATRNLPHAPAAARLARIYVLHTGQVPWEGINWRRWQDAETGKWAWDLIGPVGRKKREEPMPEDTAAAPSPAANLAEVNKVVDMVAADLIGGPDRERRIAIRKYLQENYDEDNQRWRADLSDAKAAAHFAVPPAWIADMRDFLGLGEDQNEVTQAEQAANSVAAELMADLLIFVDEAEEFLTTNLASLQALKTKIEQRFGL